MPEMSITTIPTTYTVLSQYYPSFFSLAVGRRVYLLNGSGNEIHAYLPAPVVGVELWFVAINITNTVDVKGSMDVKINGVANITIPLNTVGSTIVLSAQRSKTWLLHNLTTTIR